MVGVVQARRTGPAAATQDLIRLHAWILGRAREGSKAAAAELHTETRRRYKPYAPPPSFVDDCPCALVEVRRCLFIDADAAEGPVRFAGDSRVFDGIELVVDARGRFACAAIFGRFELLFLDEPWLVPEARFLCDA